MKTTTRNWIALTCTLLVLPIAACSSTSTAPHAGDTEDVQVRDGLEALARLLEGNQRFVRGESHHDHESQGRRAKLTGGQDPFAIVLGCSDSRVPPELILDLGLGDAFVIRVAGNVVQQDEAGSIEYAGAHLGTPLLLVLGHEACGAVTAALGAEEGHSEYAELDGLVGAVRPALVGVDPTLPHDQRVHMGVEANVRRAVERVHEIGARVDHKGERMLVAGAVYELGSGRVRVLIEPAPVGIGH